jgi:uncharacterized membrane protein YgdD (TMEM256/DUF423 family)
MTPSRLTSIGALLAAAGVALGAYGAHGLDAKLIALGYETQLAERLAWFETGVKYQLYHALALVVLGVHSVRRRTLIAAMFLTGVALFSGSLYGMTFLGDAWRKLGAVTPLGGLAFLVGWIALAVNRPAATRT